MVHDAPFQTLLALALGLNLNVEYQPLGRLGPQVEPDFLAIVIIWRKLAILQFQIAYLVLAFVRIEDCVDEAYRDVLVFRTTKNILEVDVVRAV